MSTTVESRACYRCGERKPLSAFILRVDARHYNMCRSCVSEILSQPRLGKKQRLLHTETSRTCYLCLRVLPNDRFTRRANGTFFSACKDCNRHVFAQRRRTRMNDAAGSYSVAEWRALVAQYDRCPMCRRRWDEIPPPPSRSAVITVDHVVPISKGGANTIDNVQPLCYSCNSRKGARALDEVGTAGRADR